MTGAMYAAIGGLKAHMSSLNVIGNNVANVNTNAYKAQRMTFQESIYTMSRAGSNGGVTSGGNNPSQVGYGCSVGSIDLNMSPGTYAPTGYDLDCMLMGEGFFLVGDKDTVINGSEDLTKLELTRMGDFWVDPEGYVTDRRGKCVYGFATVQNPDYKVGDDPATKTMISTKLVPLRVPLAAAEPTVANGGMVEGDDSTKWQKGDPVYDLLGVPDASNYGSRGNVSVGDYMQYDANGIYTGYDFGSTGVGQSFDPVAGELSGDPLGTDSYTGPIPNAEGERVKLLSMSIGKTGAIIGTTENGTAVTVGYVAIGQCDANDGVTHQDGYYYKCMEGAGDMYVSALGGVLDGRYLNNKQVLGEDGENPPPTADGIQNGADSEIKNGGLEASTTDIATEFSNMILTQRGYQANTRIITVTDSMLEELVNMKR